MKSPKYDPPPAPPPPPPPAPPETPEEPKPFVPSPEDYKSKQDASKSGTLGKRKTSLKVDLNTGMTGANGLSIGSR